MIGLLRVVSVVIVVGVVTGDRAMMQLLFIASGFLAGWTRLLWVALAVGWLFWREYKRQVAPTRTITSVALVKRGAGPAVGQTIARFRKGQGWDVALVGF